MRFRLTATSVPYTTNDNPDIVPIYLREYLEMMKNADATLDLPDPIFDNGKVYIHLMYGSQFVNLAKTLDKELIVHTNVTEPTIEIYDDWRE